MAYKRRMYKASRRTAYRGGKKTNLTKKVNRLSRAIVKLRPEVKYISAGETLTHNWSGIDETFMVNSIVQGTLTDVGGRIGDTIRLKDIDIQGRINGIVAAPTVSLKIILYQVKYNPDAAIASASMLNLFQESAYLGTSFAPFDYPDVDNKGAFKILAVRKFVITNQVVYNGASVAYVQGSRGFRIKHVFKGNSGLVQYFQGNTSTTKNGLRLLVVSDNTNTGTINLLTKLNYTDN